MESLLGPDDSDVDFRRILEDARDEKRCATFETFSSDGPSEFWVVSSTRWDTRQRRLNAPWRQNSSTSSRGRQWQAGLEEQRVAWSSSERKVLGAVEDYLEKCADTQVDIEALECLMEPEDEEVSFKVHLEVRDEKRQQYFPDIFQLFDTAEKKDRFVAKQKALVGVSRKEGTPQESWQNEWHDIK